MTKMKRLEVDKCSKRLDVNQRCVYYVEKLDTGQSSNSGDIGNLCACNVDRLKILQCFQTGQTLNREIGELNPAE